MKIKRAASISLLLKGQWVEGQCRKTRTEKCYPSVGLERRTPRAASFWQACAKILAAAEETCPCAAHCTELPSAHALQESSGLILGRPPQLPHKRWQADSLLQIFSLRFLMVAIMPTGIYPPGKTEKWGNSGPMGFIY